MPLDLISVFEALLTASQFLPADYEGQFRKLAHQTTHDLLCVLETSSVRDPFHIDAEELKRFKAAKTQLVELVSNPPSPGHPLHEALKPLLPAVLDCSRLMSTGTANKQQAMALVTRLRDHLGQHHQGHISSTR